MGFILEHRRWPAGASLLRPRLHPQVRARPNEVLSSAATLPACRARKNVAGTLAVNLGGAHGHRRC